MSDLESKSGQQVKSELSNFQETELGDAFGVPELLVDSDWRPVESAPKDGTSIMLYDPDFTREGHTGQFIGDYDYGWYSEYYDWALEPTHWMPLNPSPLESE